MQGETARVESLAAILARNFNGRAKVCRVALLAIESLHIHPMSQQETREFFRIHQLDTRRLLKLKLITKRQLPSNLPPRLASLLVPRAHKLIRLN